MDEKKPLTVSLSQEELFVILRYLEVPYLMGLNNAVWQGIEEDVAGLILSVAERALIARNFLVMNTVQKRFELVPPILALVGACAKPDYSLIMTLNRPRKPSEGLFFHLAGQIVVSHTIPITGIHQFIALPDKKAVARAVLSNFSLGTETVPEGKMSRITQALLVQARDAAVAGGVAGALAILAQVDLDPETRQALAITLATVKVNATLAYMDHQNDGEPAADGFTILEGENGFWRLKLVEGSSAEEELVSLQPLPGDELPGTIESLINRS
ncbi:MAG: hypothetical protein L0332_35750 [Chloroflexi bacterium]|nr:hypothetical protein [Chloroflexota bacterium]